MSAAAPFDQVQGLAFDVFGTVVDWRSSIAAEARRLLPGRNLDGERLADAWRERYQPSMERVRRGDEPWTALDDLHTASLDDVLEELEAADVDVATRAKLVQAWHRLEPWPDAREGLRRLGTRFTVATLSNGNRALLEELVASARLPFNHVLSAEDVHAYKPDPATYDLAARRLGQPNADGSVEPGRVALVAAHWNDLEAAAGRGLRTAFVARPLEWGPAAAADLDRRPWVDVYASDLEDLAAQLGC